MRQLALRTIPALQKSVFLFALLALAAPLAAGAVGLTPSYIVINDIFAGTKVKTIIYLSRANPASTELAVVEIKGPLARYIKIPNQGLVSMPKGLNNTPVEISIEPGNLAPGTYEDKIYIAPLKEREKGQQSSVFLAAAEGTIRFSVTGQAIEKFTVDNVAVKDTEVGQPVAFSYHLKNEGNVDLRPEKVTVVIAEPDDPAFRYEESLPAKLFPLVPAFSDGSAEVPTNAKLAVGSYTGVFTFWSKDGVVLETKPLPFRVVEKGVLAQKGELISLSSDKAIYQPGEIVKFVGKFKNTGTVSVSAYLTAEIFLGDQRIDLLKTDQAFVPQGATKDLELTYKPAKSGRYAAVGYAIYGDNKKTDEIRTTFRVAAKFPIYLYILIGLLILLLLALLALVVRALLRRRHSGPDGAERPPESPASPESPA